MESELVSVISVTIQEYNNKRFYLCGRYFQRDGVRLHRTVWEDAHGPIPDGYDIHHLNGDSSDNRLENLALFSRHEHHSLHGKATSAKHPEHIHEIRPLASEWHKSQKGREWHAERGKRNWAEAFPCQEYVCTQCGNSFMSRHPYTDSENRFCSAACRTHFRRVNGLDDEERTCLCCGKQFAVNKHSKQRCCSRECAVKVRWNK